MLRLCRALLIAAVLYFSYAGVVLFVIAWPYSLIAPFALACRRRATWFSSAHGTARWADTADLRRAGMLNASSGLMLGRIRSPPPPLSSGVRALFNPRVSSKDACERFLAAWRRRPRSDLVRLSRAVHTAVFSPTGGGKGVSIAIPHLLTCPDAMVSLDFKGELYRATAEHRRRVFGHRTVALDPYRVAVGRPDTFNPLDWIDRDSVSAIDECRDLAEALVLRTGQEKEPHWADSAEIWIAAMTALVVAIGEPGERSLQTVRALLTNPQELENAVTAMRSSDAWDGFLSRLGGQLTHYRDKELGSVLTTTNRMLKFLDTPLIAESTTSSSFDPADLNGGRMTVYLILPPDHMRAQSSLLRMWVGSMVRAVLKGGLRG